MKDFSIDIVKDNNYYIKSPFKGEIIRLYIDKGDSIEKGQCIAILKTGNGYVDIEADYDGVVDNIAINIDESVEKWDDIAVVEMRKEISDNFSNIANSTNSVDYDLIYTFQQEILPSLFYMDTQKFIKGFMMDKENFIFFLLSELYENQHVDIPFSVDSFNVIEQIVFENIIFIRIDWKKLNGPMLAKSIYVLINSENKKIQYFTCENSLENKLMLYSIIPVRGYLTRYNYGPAPSNPELEAERILEIFLNS